MKTLLITCCLMVAMTAYGQNTPISFEGIVKTDSTITKDQLYSAAIEWFTKTFTNSLNVIQLQDRQSGVVVGKGNFSSLVDKGSMMTPVMVETIYFTTKISCKDGRIKYDIYDYSWNGGIITKEHKDYKEVSWLIRKKMVKIIDKIREDCLSNGDMVSKMIKNHFETLKPEKPW